MFMARDVHAASRSEGRSATKPQPMERGQPCPRSDKILAELRDFDVLQCKLIELARAGRIGRL
jgi:hypothetical protein